MNRFRRFVKVNMDLRLIDIVAVSSIAAEKYAPLFGVTKNGLYLRGECGVGWGLFGGQRSCQPIHESS
ncbi:MAG: hypothetical protein U0929_01745 [Planctomycetaceae bacterium]